MEISCVTIHSTHHEGFKGQKTKLFTQRIHVITSPRNMNF